MGYGITTIRLEYGHNAKFLDSFVAIKQML